MDAHPIQDTAEALQDIFDNSVLCKLQSKPNWGLGFFVGSLEDFTGNHTGHRDKADLKLYRCSSGCTVSYDLLDTSLVSAYQTHSCIRSLIYSHSTYQDLTLF